MCSFYWLMNKEANLAYSKAEFSQAGKSKLNTGRKEAESERIHVAQPETDTKTLSGKPQPRGNTQNNGNGLN